MCYHYIYIYIYICMYVCMYVCMYMLGLVFFFFSLNAENENKRELVMDEN